MALKVDPKRSVAERLQNYLRSANRRGQFLSSLWPRVSVIEVSPTKSVFELTVTGDDCNGLGSLHGGCTASIIDVCSTGAIIAAATKYFVHGGVSNDLTISYVSAAKEGDVVLIECSIIKLGKSLANTHTVIRNKNTGQVVAMGSHTKFNSE
ncbi:9917_t:CDS:2 [Paraglomus occultum]|uniref:9917_t:CDS:1 n=1 Tax=Paraglomus occultum TaxID=144539 RepID=A0A9N8WK43_9GLOM|nr:9917_t:CDS:2 [Paraglomus occultum]